MSNDGLFLSRETRNEQALRHYTREADAATAIRKLELTVDELQREIAHLRAFIIAEHGQWTLNSVLKGVPK